MTNAKIRLATVWLAGCSGCHMSFLDLDEWLLELAERAEIVYSPVASDIKTFPSDVDVCLVEGGVANTDNLELLHQVLGLLLQSLQLLLHDALIGEQQLLLDPKQV